MTQKIETTIVSLLMLFIYSNGFSQNMDFKLIKATISNELLIDRTLESESLLEVDILPADKKYLIITAEIDYKGEQTLRLKKDDVTIGKEGNKAFGYLRLSNRGDVRWGYKGDLWKGKNYFTAIFIVNSKITKTTIHIKDQHFKIPKITQSSLSSECSPKTTVSEKEFLNSITFEDKYRRANNQSFTKKVSPKNGKLLKLSLSVEFCENAEFFKKSSFHFEPTFFQIEGSDGTLFNCVGTFSFGKFRNPSTYNILGHEKLKQDVTFIFNVPKEGKYILKYLGKEVSKF